MMSANIKLKRVNRIIHKGSGTKDNPENKIVR